MQRKRNNNKRVLLSLLYVLLISLLVGILTYALFINGKAGLPAVLAWIGIGFIVLFDVLVLAVIASASKTRKKKPAKTRTIAYFEDRDNNKRRPVESSFLGPTAPKDTTVAYMESSENAFTEPYTARPHSDPNLDIPTSLEKEPVVPTTYEEPVMPKQPKQPKPPKQPKQPKQHADKPKKTAAKKKVQIDLNIRPLDDSDFKIMRNIITTASSIILGTRKEQQDALYVSDTTFFGPGESGDAFGVVCDGMGGLANGSDASKTAVRILSGLYRQSRPVADVGTFYKNAILRAQSEVSALSASNPDGQRAGTTLVSTIIQNDKLYTAAVGDSRIYIVRNGQIRMLTRDHNYYLILTEQLKNGQITQEQLNSASQKEALISYLGMPELKLMDIMSSPLQLVDGDVVLLCSDGLTKALTKEEICGIILENADKLQNCAEMLTAAAQRKKPRGLDNTSVILLKYN